MARDGDEDDQDICRVCRSEASAAEPLFYPCRCTGSIRYVHADCLEEWLRHSKKETCELCKARFRFTKLYEPNMPKRIPKHLLVKKMILHSALLSKFILRLFLAAYIWLGVVPTMIYWQWSGIWWHGSWLAYGLYGNPQRAFDGSAKVATPSDQDQIAKSSLRSSLHSMSEPVRLLAFPIWAPLMLSFDKLFRKDTASREWVNYKPKIGALALTAGKGQLVIIFVAMTFLVVILLRDWVSHNVPQDVLLDFVDPDPPPPVPPTRPLVREPAAEETINEGEPSIPSSGPDRFEDSMTHQNRSSEDRPSAEVPTGEAPPTPPVRPVPRHDWSNWYNAALHNSQKTEELENGTQSQSEGSSRFAERDLGRDDAVAQPDAADVLPSPPQVLPNVPQGDDATAAADAAAAAAAAAVVAAEADEEDDDDVEELFDTTLESVLEIVGVEGSLLSLFKNAALVTVAIAFCLSLQIWAPFVLGKTLMLASPPTVFRIPILAVKYLSQTVAVTFTMATRHISHPTAVFLKGLNLSSSTLVSLEPLKRLLGRHLSSSWVREGTTYWKAFTQHLVVVPDLPVTQFTTSLREAGLTILAAGIERWNLLSRTDTVSSRVVAILIGLAASSFVAILGAEQIPAGSSSTMRSIRASLKEYKTAAKVAFFIGVELIIFPLYCGFLLDLATLPLLPSGTGHARLEQLLNFPTSALYMHWFAGTAFMFSFAMFVASCREIVRSGVFYWIRDPGDPTFHPVKEIVERSTLSQMHKLLSSAVMYGTIIMVGIGLVLLMERKVWTSLLPLHLPAVSAHGDKLNFLLLDQIIPLVLYWIRPRQFARHYFALWWRWAARRLRLSSFMFGVRNEREEGHLVYPTWKGWVMRAPGADPFVSGTRQEKSVKSNGNGSDHADGIAFVRDGGFIRVPARDTIPILKKHSMIIRVDEGGRPLTDADRELMHLQDTNKIVDPGWQPETEQDKANKFKVVYIPPHFRFRLVIFVLGLWMTLALAFVLPTGLAVLSGRWIQKRIWLDRTPNDLECLMLLLPLVSPLILIQKWWNKKSALRSTLQRCAKIATTLFSMAVLLASTLTMIRFHIWYPIMRLLQVPSDILQATTRMVWFSEALFAMIIFETCALFATLDERLPCHGQARFLQQCRKASSGGHFPVAFYSRMIRDILAPVAIGTAVIILGPMTVAVIINTILGRHDALLYFDICFYHLTLHIAYFLGRKLASLSALWLHFVRDQIYLRGKQLRNFDEVDVPDSLPLHQADRPVIHVP